MHKPASLTDVVVERLPHSARVLVPPGVAAGDVEAAGRSITVDNLETADDGSADAVLLLDDQLSVAGEHAEGVLAEAARVLRRGGWLAATALNRLYAAATRHPLNGMRGFSAVELGRLLGQRGFRAGLLCAPRAAAGLRGADDIDLDLDRQPGLLDAGPQLLALARSPGSAQEHSEAFFAALPRKIVAAGVVCRGGGGRLLLVYDSFKQEWTIPGGVVDADEDPRAAARRETWEEAGVRVTVGALLGLFALPWPDRLLLVYDAQAAGPDSVPSPVHTHEIDKAGWVELDEALRLVPAHRAAQLRRCLKSPGGSWSAQDLC